MELRESNKKNTKCNINSYRRAETDKKNTVKKIIVKFYLDLFPTYFILSQKKPKNSFKQVQKLLQKNAPTLLSTEIVLIAFQQHFISIYSFNEIDMYCFIIKKPNKILIKLPFARATSCPVSLSFKC